MHTHVRGMSTRWGERDAVGPQEDRKVHDKGKYGKKTYNGQDGQVGGAIIKRIFFARACFGEDRYVSCSHHPMAYVGASYVLTYRYTLLQR